MRLLGAWVFLATAAARRPRSQSVVEVDVSDADTDASADASAALQAADNSKPWWVHGHTSDIKKARAVRDNAIQQTQVRASKEADQAYVDAEGSLARVIHDKTETEKTKQSTEKIRVEVDEVYNMTRDYDVDATLAEQRAVSSEANGEQAKNLASSADDEATRAITSEESAQKAFQDAQVRDLQAEALFKSTMAEFEKSRVEMAQLYTGLQRNQRHLDQMKVNLKQQDMAMEQLGLKRAQLDSNVIQSQDAIQRMGNLFPVLHRNEAASEEEMVLIEKMAERPWKMWWRGSGDLASTFGLAALASVLLTF